MFSSTQAYVPQCSPRATSLKGALVVWSVVLALALALPGLIVGAPLAQARGHNLFALTVYGAFSLLCHQIPERSFHLAGHSFAVCARCTGLYVGFALGVLVYPLGRSLRQLETPRRRWLLAACVPTLIDWALGFSGIWENTHLSRFATAALLGAVCAFYVVPGLVDLSLYGWGYLFPARRAAASSGDERRVADVLLTSTGRSAPSDYSSPSSRI
jgi:uncharacterized membrane protein